jgi:hypothetical protein
MHLDTRWTLAEAAARHLPIEDLSTAGTCRRSPRGAECGVIFLTILRATTRVLPWTANRDH